MRLDAMRINPVVSQAELIQKLRRERVQFADGCAAIGIILIARGEPAAIKKTSEGTRGEDGLVLVTETGEEVILFGKSVVEADVEIVLLQALLGIDKIVIPVDVYIRSGK